MPGMRTRRPRIVPIVLALAATIGPLACSGPPVRLRADDRPPGASAPSEEAIAERVARVVALHNAERVEEDLPKLVVSPRLEAAARRHAEDMARRRVMSHKGADGTSPMERIEQTGYAYRRAGENVAYGRHDPATLMKGWMDSPPHKKNVLGSFSQIGAACAIAEDGTAYWCVTFGRPNRP